MQLWPSDFFSWEAVVRNITFLLLVVSVGMTTLYWLRVVAIAAGLTGILHASFISYDPTALFWWTFFVLMCAVQLALSRSRKIGRPLNPEERLFHETTVPSLGSGQVRKLLTAGKWLNGDRGQVLTRQGHVVGSLFFIAGGTVDVLVDGQKIAEVGPGKLIGEIGIATGDPATATCVCAAKVRYLEFVGTRLYRVLDGRNDLLGAVEGAVQSSLREKLQAANAAAAHPEMRG